MGWAPRALHPDIKALSGDGTPLVGFAATVVGRLERFSGPDRRKLAFADGLSAHDVAVWSGTDAGGFCLFGDLIAASMQRAGAAGAIVDGGFRDRDAIHATGFPVHARFVT